MTDVLILDEQEAAKIRGRSPKDSGKALDPVPTKDGRFYLGLEVLDDPAHEDVREFLQSVPIAPLEKLPRYVEGEERPEVVETADLAARGSVVLEASKLGPTRRTP